VPEGWKKGKKKEKVERPGGRIGRKMRYADGGETGGGGDQAERRGLGELEERYRRTKTMRKCPELRILENKSSKVRKGKALKNRGAYRNYKKKGKQRRTLKQRPRQMPMDYDGLRLDRGGKKSRKPPETTPTDWERIKKAAKRTDSLEQKRSYERGKKKFVERH